MYLIFKLAWRELVANKSRSILTALGIIIGVLAVTLIFASGEIAQTYLSSQLLSAVGDTKAIRVDPFGNTRLETTEMTIDDYNYIKSQFGVFPITKSFPDYRFNVNIKNLEDRTVNQAIISTDQDYILSTNLSNLQGRFFSKAESDNGDRVAVVSRTFARNIKGKSSLLNDVITLGNASFTVIGEYDSTQTIFSNGEEVIVPLSAGWEVGNAPTKPLIGISFVVEKESQVDYVATRLQDSVNGYRASQNTGAKAEPLNFRTAKSALETVGTVLTAFQIFLGLVAFISLLVGGIGVLNVMLMSVTQRVREIGIRRALGAKNWDIISIFLTESILLTTFSGIIGAGLAQYFVFLGVNVVAIASPGVNLAITYSWASLYYSTLLSLVLGAGFGIYPAIQASRLSIVEALRYD
jgi:putative ABC transport system permease protein